MDTIVQANILGPELLVVVGIVVLLFGGSKLPELAKGLGQSMKEFKKAVHEDPDPDKPEKSVEKVADKSA